MRALPFGPDRIAEMNALLQEYVGTHTWHNFSVRIEGDDPNPNPNPNRVTLTLTPTPPSHSLTRMYGYARGFGHDHKIGVLVFNLNILRDARRFVAMHEVPDASGLRHHHIFPHGEALHPQMARRDGPLVVRPGPEWKILKEDIEERPLGPASDRKSVV